ncbi:MAG: hypothetical protein MJ172_04815 [Clostridia bacterium]|nr:hypothetical protein [Clostridia bacterium]
MADSKKLKKGLNTKAKNNVIIGAIIAVVIVAVVGYMIYISGFATRVMTGMKITNVTPEGKTVVVDNVSVAELNLHYYQVLNTYYSQGVITGDTDLDAVLDETTGKTLKQTLYDEAADEIKNIYYLLEWGKVNVPNYQDLKEVAQHYMDVSIDNLRDTSKSYGYPSVNNYLQAMYGTGVSLRVYRSVIEEQILAELLQNYVQQFQFSADKADLQKTHDENPLTYMRADVNAYAFSAESTTEEDGTVVFDNTSALEKANKVAEQATDPLTFNLAVMDLIDDPDTLAQFETADDPTLQSGITTSWTSSLAGGIMQDFVFETGEIGTCQVFELESVVWVVLLNDRYENNEDTVTYRTLVLYNDKRAADGCTEAQIAAGADKLEVKANEIVASITDEQSFAAAVGRSSSNINDVIDGGLSDGMTYEDYSTSDGSEIPTATLQLRDWLFDANRQPGDMTVIRNVSNTTVTIYYFVDSVPAWMYIAEQQVITTRTNIWSQDQEFLPSTAGVQIAYELAEKLTY